MGKASNEILEVLLCAFIPRVDVRLIADAVVGRGTLNHAPVYPREIARRARVLSASAIIRVHTHPSGDPTPSRRHRPDA